MNHGPDFQKLWAQLRREVQDLQRKGYYGDGTLRVFHSVKHSLKDIMSIQAIGPVDRVSTTRQTWKA